ncbi:hypothetical protein B0H14DRAFT_3491387 [Mycena olivaceomarginata]|nr:hypothetical protein B0H14DRAFT_3491387 [Mycena olivaceomarginata]
MADMNPQADAPFAQGKSSRPSTLAVGRAIPSPTPFDVGERLREQLLEQDATGQKRPALPPPDADPSAASTSSAPSAPSPPDPPLTSSQRNKLKFKARRARTREKARLLSDNPLLKGVHRKRIDGAKGSALHLGVDAGALPHTKRGWMGPRPVADEMAEDGNEGFEASEPPPLHPLDNGLGGMSYTQAEVDALSGTVGFMYIAWLGKLTIPILDSHRRIIALLGGTPRD